MSDDDELAQILGESYPEGHAEASRFVGPHLLVRGKQASYAAIECPSCAKGRRVPVPFPGWIECGCGRNIFWRDVQATAKPL